LADTKNNPTSSANPPDCRLQNLECDVHHEFVNPQ
jgi:hypothetical protein